MKKLLKKTVETNSEIAAWLFVILIFCFGTLVGTLIQLSVDSYLNK